MKIVTFIAKPRFNILDAYMYMIATVVWMKLGLIPAIFLVILASAFSATLENLVASVATKETTERKHARERA